MQRCSTSKFRSRNFKSWQLFEDPDTAEHGNRSKNRPLENTMKSPKRPRRAKAQKLPTLKKPLKGAGKAYQAAPKSPKNSLIPRILRIPMKPGRGQKPGKQPNFKLFKNAMKSPKRPPLRRGGAGEGIKPFSDGALKYRKELKNERPFRKVPPGGGREG